MRTFYSMIGWLCGVAAGLCLLASFAVFNKGAFAYIDHTALLYWLGSGVALATLSMVCFAMATFKEVSEK